ncbi:Crp/Fnr family transcriptional regulator [Myroides sp. LJL119]
MLYFENKASGRVKPEIINLKVKKMLDELKEKLQLTDKQWQDYSSCFTCVELPAKTTVLKQGEIPKKMFLIQKGCIRVWFDMQGKEITCQFFFENQVVGSIESFIKQQPSPTDIQTIEPCVLWWVHKDDLDRILFEIKQIPHLREMFINKIFQRTFDYMNYFFSTLKYTAQQRYENLVLERPEVVQRVAQHYIASYLGISTVHLSRIKAKLAKGKRV